MQKKDSMYSSSIKPLNVLNVYSDKLQMCIAQDMIEEKTNEIPAIPEVIKRLDLKEVVCTGDALNTQTESIKAVIGKKGDYCVALKRNQGTFYENVKDYFDEDRLKLIQVGFKGSYMCSCEKSHGEIEKYEYYQTEDVKWYSDYKKWEKLRSIGVVVKTITKPDNTVSIEKRYYISSLTCDIQTFAECIRKHWNVGNKLHWQIDYTFKCDNNTTINKKALFNLQIIKKI